MDFVCSKWSLNFSYSWSQVARGLAGETPHMISAAVKGLARLAYEFSDLVSSAYKLLPSTFLLLQRKNREIIKVCSLSSLWPHNLLMVISLYFIFCTASLMFCGCLWCRLIWVCWKYWWPNQKLKACKHTWPAWWKACWSGKMIPKIILRPRFVLLFQYYWFLVIITFLNYLIR